MVVAGNSEGNFDAWGQDPDDTGSGSGTTRGRDTGKETMAQQGIFRLGNTERLVVFMVAMTQGKQFNLVVLEHIVKEQGEEVVLGRVLQSQKLKTM